ncbi:histidinol-phosphatase HisJ [Caldalkalibacillus salinus]|uniref:histidinol-phosphatase HisJ n=1 Tax=Caldalkalibacillus salinus TaxID=2803787 RepID=UPI0019244410|nr:histidinol-phosphatase HisJ [Caldalkalibacillus salinus]
MLKWDAHTHSPFCPHGSQAALESYIEQAIRKGFERYSITEHAPLPQGFTDPVPQQDSAMRMCDLEPYLYECERLKKKYQSEIEILTGLEIDYITGYEAQTQALLEHVGPQLDDAILSVHFLPVGQHWTCLDYSADQFSTDLIPFYGTVDDVYLQYYNTLEKAVLADLGTYKPKRIGHITLIEKFKQIFRPKNKDKWWGQLMYVLDLVRKYGYTLDFNTAGLRKEHCRDIYPSEDVLQEALKLDIPFIYGSDAHDPKDVGSEFARFERLDKT